MHQERLRVTAALALALGLTLSAGSARASEVGTSRAFGLGGMLGAPTGLSLKYYFSPQHALDVGIGIGWLGGSGLHIHVDYLFHFALARTPSFDLPLYIGVGPKLAIWFYDHGTRYWGYKGDGGVGFGVRVPIGIAFNLNAVPVDVFIEAVPGIGFVPGVGGFLDGAVGARYYF